MLTQAEHRELGKRVSSRRGRADDARIARVLLLLADGASYTQVQQKVGCTAPYISKWKRLFLEERLAGLYSRHEERPIQVLTPRKVKDISYLDIGAYDPILINNTYYFYRQGHRGVLVEPNVTICGKLMAVRPEDTTLVAGIGATAVSEADYYVMSEPSWSTFSKEEAEHQKRVTNGELSIQEVRRLPLLDVNAVMEEHFDGAPSSYPSMPRGCIPRS